MASIILALVPLASVIGIFVERILTNRGLGVRTIQFAAITSMLPVVAILALDGKIDGNTVSTLMGAMIGYLFANISNFENKKNDTL